MPLPTLTIDDVEYTVLRGDPDKVRTDPRFDSLAVMCIEGDEARILEVQWIADEQRWWSYPDGTTIASVAALRTALLPKVSIVTADNGRIWSVHSTPEAATAAHNRAAAAAREAAPGQAAAEFYATGIEHHEVEP